MFERFTKNARSAVVAAQESARELRSPEIGVEHLLLGLLEEAEPALHTLLESNGITLAVALRELGTAARDEPLGAEDAEALRSIGIDLDAVRESLEANFGADALDRAAVPEESRSRRMRFGHIPFSRDAKKIVELSLREALARKDKTIESGHILLAILRAPNPVTTELLGGPDGLSGLRDQVNAHLDRAA
ncbi:Clp protease N-terminal domain-containing protein [Nocardia sp. CA-290969]|uniref:Clp protease N-terminal domain-containing protein n=1 Tax=Nocardia sp. CA-290969 TaxID=3239986 RepID=UPI003D9491BA